MINLTSFIGNKIKSGVIPSPSYPTNCKPSHQESNQSKKPSFHQQYQNISQRSIGLSTLLDLQNEQEVFGEFNISRIGAQNSFLKHFKRESNISSSRDVKSEIEQMRQRRKALEEKVNRTLGKQEYRNKAFEVNGSKMEERQLSFTESQKGRQQNGQSQISQSKPSQNPSIVVEQESGQESSLRTSQVSYNQSQQQHSQQKSCSHTYHYPSFDSSLCKVSHPTKDIFMTYLHKQMYLLKCEKFIKYMNNFKFGFLIKNMKQFDEMKKIIKREQLKLCRFVFVSWKRETKEGVQKIAMVEMIRKRVEQKRTMERNTKKETIIKKETIMKIEENKIQQKNISQTSIVKQNLCNSNLQLPKSRAIPTHDYSIPQIHKNNPMTLKHLKQDQINQNTSNYYYSQLNIQQVSPIKSRPQDEQHYIHPLNQASFYSKYSCFTEKDNQEYQDEYIK